MFPALFRDCGSAAKPPSFLTFIILPFPSLQVMWRSCSFPWACRTCPSAPPASPVRPRMNRMNFLPSSILRFKPLFLPHLLPILPSPFLPSKKHAPPSSLFHPYVSLREPPPPFSYHLSLCATYVLLPFPPLCGTQHPSLITGPRQAPCLGKKQGNKLLRSLKERDK